MNNAGFYRRNAFEETDDAAFLARWRETMAVNLEAAAHLSFLALPAMRGKAWGRIVMIASRSAFRAETDHPDYAVSKAGMVNLARCLARNEGPHGITANAVCPGWVRTEAVREALDGPQAAEVLSQIPLGRVASTGRRRERGALPRLPPRLVRERHRHPPERRFVPPLRVRRNSSRPAESGG